MVTFAVHFTNEQCLPKARKLYNIVAVVFLMLAMSMLLTLDVIAQESVDESIEKNAAVENEKSVEQKERSLRRERQIKAAFLFNFLKFIEWPESKSADNVICFLRENTFGDSLTPLTKKRVRGNPISIVENVTLEEISQCNILYIDDKYEESLDTLLLDVYLYPILTVGEIKHFAFKGGVVGFYREGKRIRFAINTSRAERLGLKMSSKLLELARVVR